MIHTCDCQRLFCHPRESLLRKKINFFSRPCVFWAPKASRPSVTSDCLTAQSAAVHGCFLSLLFFLFLFMWSREGRYFPLPSRASIYLIAPLGLVLPDPNACPNPIPYPNPNPNPKPNPNLKLHSGNYQ